MNNNQDAYDKHDLSIQFVPAVTYTPQIEEAAEKIAEIYRSDKSSDEKSEQVWKILNS